MLASLTGGSASAREPDSVQVTVLDDGEKIARDLSRPLPPSAWPEGDIALFALRDETVAFQVVVEATFNAPLEHVRIALDAFEPALAADVEVLAERFIDVTHASYNDRFPGSLAFTPQAAPPAGEYVGAIADPLVAGDAHAGPGERAALWVDVHVPADARAGSYRAMMHVQSADRTLAERPLSLRVIDVAIPYPGAEITTYYDPETLRKRMGDLRAEPSLRQTLHAHRVSAIRAITIEADAAREEEALTGRLYTPEEGYVGPGIGIGDGILAIGAYGTMGEPDAGKAAEVGRMAARARAICKAGAEPAMFVYAVDEDCKSPRAGRWLELLRAVPEARGVHVAVTCGQDPREQMADLVLVPPDDYAPSDARRAREAGKTVWVYNGQRPYAGAMMLDVPASDLRANAWIAARYRIPRWFYWESTFWLDDNRGGRGGPDGFDPYAVAETFHNAHGDHANGDGILVYPGKQIAAGMHDEGKAVVYASIRLKNLRRGAEDAGYIQIARAIDAAATDAIVEDIVPRALGDASKTTAWPERGLPWLTARAALRDVITHTHAPHKHESIPWFAWLLVPLIAIAALLVTYARRTPST